MNEREVVGWGGSTGRFMCVCLNQPLRRWGCSQQLSRLLLRAKRRHKNAMFFPTPLFHSVRQKIKDRAKCANRTQS